VLVKALQGTIPQVRNDAVVRAGFVRPGRRAALMDLVKGHAANPDQRRRLRQRWIYGARRAGRRAGADRGPVFAK